MIAGLADVVPSLLSDQQVRTTFSALVVSHEPTTRLSLATGLAALGAEPLHEAGSAGEALLCARTWGPCDLGVLDLELPGELALELLADLRTRGWQQLVVLANATDRSAAGAAFRLGAHGFLLKPSITAPDPGLPARDPEPTLPPVVPQPAKVVGATGATEELTSREIQVLHLVARGHTNNGVGEALGLSGLTVKSHLSRISHKLATGDRAHLVALAMRAGVVV